MSGMLLKLKVLNVLSYMINLLAKGDGELAKQEASWPAVGLTFIKI